MNSFEVISDITDIETIAVGSEIRDLGRLRKIYGRGRWRKVKGTAMIRLRIGPVRRAEIHWHEPHGIAGKNLSANAI